ncbi:MAG: TlpA family protein disulfide reductase [Allomuricauda sp.]
MKTRTTPSIRKLAIVAFSLCIFGGTKTVQAQKDGFQSKVLELRKSLQDSIHFTQADIDFTILDKMKSFFATSEESKVYRNTSILGARRYEDKMYKRRMQLAEKFLDKYPQDKRYDKVLGMFLNMNFEPYFIAETITDSIEQFLNAVPIKSSLPNKNEKYFYGMRKLAWDNISIKRWQRKGDELVSNILDSNSSIERKEKFEAYLLFRDIRFAIRWISLLDKIPSEVNYRQHLDTQYWNGFRLRLELHLRKYSSLKIAASRVQPILEAFKVHAPFLIKPYWEYFFKITDSTNVLSDQPAFKTLHNLAAENLKAIEALESFDGTRPLDMTFTAMDGTKVDLAKMRGKVVLIDFWSISCAPCIKEMPHVQAMYDKYKDQGFEVIGLAANGDGNKKQIQSILKKTRASWPQRLDKGKDATVSYHSLYDIKSLPTVWLLDKNGVIVDKQARGNRLEPLIRKHLGLDN